MPTTDAARDGADAVKLFADALRARHGQPGLIQARLDGRDGMAALCAVEEAIADLLPAAAKELIWLTGAGDGGGVLHLQARARDGALLCAASFRLTG